MPETLSIALTPGYLFASGELVTLDKLNLQARPNIVLTGSIGSATITDGAVTTVKLADGVLSADTTGRNKMADGYVTAPKLNNTQDWTGKTLSGSPTVNWSGAITLTGTVNLTGATVTWPAGSLVQTVYTSSAAATTVSNSIPVDTSIPQVGEGTEIAGLTTIITPTDAGHVLELELIIRGQASASGSTSVVAIFRDGGANALAADYFFAAGSDSEFHMVIKHRVTAGSTSATTFTVRAGRTAGTLTINGRSGATILGGTTEISLTVREIAA
jgi:hypothetical protein